MEHIARLEPVGVSSVVLDEIAATYAAIEIVFCARTKSATNVDNLWLRFNDDDDTNYDYFDHRKRNANDDISYVDNDTEFVLLAGAAGDDCPSGHFAFGEWLIGNANAGLPSPKSVTGRTYNIRTGTGTSREQRYWSGRWQNTVDAINQIEIGTASGEEFMSGSYFDVFGLPS